MRRLLGLALVAALCASPASPTTQSATWPPLPPRLDEYLTTHVRLSAAERHTLTGGTPITKLLQADETKEVAVFGAVWIAAPLAEYIEHVSDIENFERGGGFTITKRLSSPPRLQDFAALRLPERDLEELPSCRVGDCVVKLGDEAIRRLKAEIDWKSGTAADAANALMREFALQYVTGYLEGGNDRLAVYRDHSRPRFVAQEFRTVVDQMPELTTYMPAVRRYLLEYPKAALPGSTSFLYWQETEFGLRPTLRISHVTIHQEEDDAVVMSKMLYASHYFWTGLELRVLLADPPRGPGFWFVTVSRSRSDGLSGFTGMFIRGRARSEVQDGTLAGLHATKRRLEARRSPSR